MKIRSVLVGLTVVLGATASTPTLASAEQPAQQELTKYVAMGDSFASGMNTVVDLAAGGLCAQGTVSYPKIIAQQLPAELTDMTCNGATLATMGLQIGAVPADTDLITVTTGMNDIPWADLFVACGFPGLIPVGAFIPEFGACSFINDALGGGVQQRADAYRANLRTFLDQLSVQAPNARIFLVGYPKILPDPAEACWPIVPLTGKDLTFYEELLTSQNKVMIEFAQDPAYPRVGYVDTHYGSRGHDMCKGDKAWVNPWFSFAYGLAPAHPTEAGIKAMGAEVMRTLALAGG